jgi:hypothetical protein
MQAIATKSPVSTNAIVFKPKMTIAAKDAVVQNDTAAPTALATELVTLQALEDHRKLWETTVYRTSNQQLYKVLDGCYAYGAKLPLESAKQRSEDLKKFFADRGYRVNHDAPLLTRIVKAVFGNVDRRRISTYSLVLRSATAAGVAPGRLAQWIEENGGIQEIKLGRSKTFVSAATKITTAKQSLAKSSVLGVAKSPALGLLADADFIGSACVLLAEQQADGGFTIKALVRAESAVNAAWSAVYSQQKKAA